MSTDYLVPGRTCGDCRACARLPGVDGARIGDERTQTFHCLWRRLDHMDDSWRPDRRGLVMTLAQAPTSERQAIVQMWISGDPDRLDNADFASMAAGFVANGTEVVLTRADGSGPAVPLAPLIGPAVERRDQEGVFDSIRMATAMLIHQPAPNRAPFRTVTPASPVMPVVETRECGDCIACCVVLEIEDPKLSKPAGETCRNCLSGGGCAIYRDRPETCRTFHCLWRHMPDLDESWRPDRSGIMILASTAPGHIPGKPALEFVLLNDEGRARAATEDFARLAAAHVDAGSDTLVQRLNPGGANGVQARLTGALMPAILTGETRLAVAAVARRLDQIDAQIAST